MIAVAMLLGALEKGTDRHIWRRPTEEQVAYSRQLQSWGYSLSEIEMLILAAERPVLDESDTSAEEVAMPRARRAGEGT